MRNIRFNKLAYIPLFAFLISCNSYNLPPKEESVREIEQIRLKLGKLDAEINSKVSGRIEKDLHIVIKQSAINNLLTKVANSRKDDLVLFFSRTIGLIKEEKSILNIKYSNYVNIDTGHISINLKKFTFDKIDNNRISGIFEIEGKGNISVTGKYSGIPASVSPDVELYLFENISFLISNNSNGNLILTPYPKTMKLKTKISINLLAWKIPWYQEVELQLTDLIKPLEIPVAISPEIKFPLPNEQAGKGNVQFTDYKVELKNTDIRLIPGIIDYQTNLQFNKKTK